MEGLFLSKTSNEIYFDNILNAIKFPLEEYFDTLKKEGLIEEEIEEKAINRVYIETELRSFFANKENFSMDDEDYFIRAIDSFYRRPIKDFINNFIKPVLGGKIEYKDYSIIEIYNILQKYKDEILKQIDD